MQKQPYNWIMSLFQLNIYVLTKDFVKVWRFKHFYNSSITTTSVAATLSELSVNVIGCLWVYDPSAFLV